MEVGAQIKEWKEITKGGKQNQKGENKEGHKEKRRGIRGRGEDGRNDGKE